jgi:hypothetical protein
VANSPKRRKQLRNPIYGGLEYRIFAGAFKADGSVEFNSTSINVDSIETRSGSGLFPEGLLNNICYRMIYGY